MAIRSTLTLLNWNLYKSSNNQFIDKVGDCDEKEKGREGLETDRL